MQQAPILDKRIVSLMQSKLELYFLHFVCAAEKIVDLPKEDSTTSGCRS